MKRACLACNVAKVLIVIASLTVASMVAARASDQLPAERPTANVIRVSRADDPIQAIDDEYNRQVIELARRRLDRLRASRYRAKAGRGGRHV